MGTFNLVMVTVSLANMALQTLSDSPTSAAIWFGAAVLWAALGTLKALTSKS